MGEWVGAGEGGPTLWVPTPSPPFSSADPRSRSLARQEGVCAGGRNRQARRQGGPRLPTPAPSPPPADSVWPLACGCVFVCQLFHLACSLQLNPFQTRGALTRHHDEAESGKQTRPAAVAFFPSPLTPCPTTLMLTHTAPRASLNSQRLCGGWGRGSTDHRKG